jgi:hypothetical protein
MKLEGSFDGEYIRGEMCIDKDIGKIKSPLDSLQIKKGEDA